jgi:Sulfatase
MIRAIFLGCVFLIFPALAHAQQPRKKPNVIVIITDDQRWNAFSLAGHKQLKTPHIDRLGKEGVWSPGLRGFTRNRLRKLDAGHLVQGADDNVVSVWIANDEIGPKEEGKIGVTDLMNIAI